MKRTYHIQGMTCNGCRNHVEQTLSKVDGVKDVSVDLEKAEASIDMETHIPIENFQNALQEDSARYNIHSPGHHTTMTHTYAISGMTCKGCRNHVEQTLSKVKGVAHVSVHLEKAAATIEMESHIPIETLKKALQEDGGGYAIHKNPLPASPKERSQHSKSHPSKKSPLRGLGASFYCPMHCEGDKTYDKPRDCPVCGMDLVQEQQLPLRGSGGFTCPMHPEVVKDASGSCPICGMDLVPVEPDLSAEEKTYKKLLKKFWIAVAFTLPIFIIAMSEMIPNNPLYGIMEQKWWNWIQFGLSIPVVFYATWMFFERAYKSIKTWNLNMFTLIGIGAGVAWLFSVFGMLFPDFFPEQFETESERCMSISKRPR